MSIIIIPYHFIFIQGNTDTLKSLFEPKHVNAVVSKTRLNDQEGRGATPKRGQTVTRGRPRSKSDPRDKTTIRKEAGIPKGKDHYNKHVKISVFYST